MHMLSKGKRQGAHGVSLYENANCDKKYGYELF